jgi:hypothetical protein
MKRTFAILSLSMCTSVALYVWLLSMIGLIVPLATLLIAGAALLLLAGFLTAAIH